MIAVEERKQCYTEKKIKKWKNKNCECTEEGENKEQEIWKIKQFQFSGNASWKAIH
jgi:hypothetical protein